MSKRRKQYTIEEVNNICSQRGGECLSTKYVNNKLPLTFRCNLGHEWTINFKAIHIQKQWCPYCSGRHNNNLSVVRQLAEERKGKCLSTRYVDNKTNLKWQCGDCLGVWNARLDRVKSGTWCPHCRRSWGERSVQKYLECLGINFIPEYLLTECDNQRFDFYIPSSNLAVEYDGIQHFQIYGRYSPTTEVLEKVQKKDIRKTLYCIKNNIRLLRIAYTDLEKVNEILDFALNNEDEIILTDMTLYEYIEKNIPKNNPLR